MGYNKKNCFCDNLACVYTKPKIKQFNTVAI